MGLPDRIWLPPSIDQATRRAPTGWLAEQRRNETQPAAPQVPPTRAERRRMQRAIARQTKKGGGR